MSSVPPRSTCNSRLRRAQMCVTSCYNPSDSNGDANKISRAHCASLHATKCLQVPAHWQFHLL